MMLNPPPLWANQPLVVYHGTTAAVASVIVTAGVAISSGRGGTDFGPGFYTTTLERQARAWAWQKAQQVAMSKPAVVKFSIDRDQLAGLEAMSFVRGDYDAEQFWSLVVHCRTGAMDHARTGTPFYYDVVFGPVAAFWQQRVAMQDADQVSFHTPAAEKLLNASGGSLCP